MLTCGQKNCKQIACFSEVLNCETDGDYLYNGHSAASDAQREFAIGVIHL
jgi:hypothetical protein